MNHEPHTDRMINDLFDIDTNISVSNVINVLQRVLEYDNINVYARNFNVAFTKIFPHSWLPLDNMNISTRYIQNDKPIHSIQVNSDKLKSIDRAYISTNPSLILVGENINGVYIGIEIHFKQVVATEKSIYPSDLLK